jgi:hypothetical protein
MALGRSRRASSPVRASASRYARAALADMRGGVRWSIGTSARSSDAAGQYAGLLARTRNVPATVGRLSALGVCRRAQGPGAVACRRASERHRIDSVLPAKTAARNGRHTPRITDRTIGARVRLPWGERRGAASTDLSRVEGVATHRHKRCLKTTRGLRVLSSSTTTLRSPVRRRAGLS